ncbi:hypothetical protein ACTJJT_24505 [Pseudomonas sp. 22373]|uniref:Uncharacterized protein n=1 Tax=Pseudomonas juntendi TaxID=2666183 RepID=A0ABD4YIS9_9PSED|nr:hypothetical protein [Pseudomonas juntendi]MDH0759361.1 hypothetical protein [Pseudomonas juntendi]MDH1921398.1 hypothetical protein [Pseudomonas juntendi]
MSDEIRLPELVSEYAKYYGVDVPDAAHALHELIGELHQEYKAQGRFALPSHVFWVGRVDSSRHSIRKYKLFFEGVLNYFYGLYGSVSKEGFDLVTTYSESCRDTRDVPAGLIFLSKKTLAEWFGQAGIEVPKYFLVEEASAKIEISNEGKASRAKEMASIGQIISGLVDLIKEVDRAHTEQPVDDKARMRADTIKLRAARLHDSSSIYNLCTTILNLADAAEADMPRSHKTLEKYMDDSFRKGTKKPR